MSPLLTFTVAILGGVVPPVLWLLFLLREDSLHPEPKKYLRRSFFFGMIAVLVALPFEYLSDGFFEKLGVVLLAWSVIEELLKLVAAYFGGLHTKALNEPLDAVIYTITAALGFAALENVFFLLNPEASQSLAHGIITSNVRFVGATLLHTVASGTIGISMALSYYKSRKKKIQFMTVGTILAILLHALYNYRILGSEQSNLFFIFSFVWLAVILVITFMEKIKRVRSKKEMAAL